MRNFDISLRILGLFHKSAAVKWYAVLTGYGDTVENTVENSEPDPGSHMLNEYIIVQLGLSAEKSTRAFEITPEENKWLLP